MGAAPKTNILGACRNGNLITLRALLSAGASVNARNRNGTTALMLAAAYGNDRAVSLLLELGARVEERNAEGTTALMFAVRRANALAVRSLLDAGADPLVCDNAGKCALDDSQAANVSVRRELARAIQRRQPGE